MTNLPKNAKSKIKLERSLLDQLNHLQQKEENLLISNTAITEKQKCLKLQKETNNIQGRKVQLLISEINSLLQELQDLVFPENQVTEETSSPLSDVEDISNIGAPTQEDLTFTVFEKIGH